MTNTYTGQASTDISADSIREAIEKLVPPAPTDLHHILENCTLRELEAMFQVDMTQAHASMTALYGVPVYKVSWIPEHEAWLIDREGKIIQRYTWQSENHTTQI